MMALQRQLALHPDLIPEPASKGTAVIRPLLMRFCSVAALAVLVAWGLASYSGVKKTAEIPTSIPEIASNHSNGLDVRPSQLRPTLSPTADALTPIGNSRPVAIATSDAAAVTSVAVAAPTNAQAVTLAPATSQRADDRRPLRLDSEEIAVLIKRGKDLLADGDLAAAAAPPRQTAPKAPSRLERHLTQPCSSASVRLARRRILPRHANGINAPPNSALAPPRSNWQAWRTVVEVTDARGTGHARRPLRVVCLSSIA